MSHYRKISADTNIKISDKTTRENFKKHCLVSVVIPTYHSSATIRQSLDAIFKQDYPYIEVIVVDDASSDSTVHLAAKYRCKVIELKKNCGPSVARNAGAQNARGEIIFFVDSDVVLQENAVSVAVKNFMNNPEIAAVTGIYSDKLTDRASLNTCYRSLLLHYWRKTEAGYIKQPNFALGAIKKSVFDEAGGFDPLLRNSEHMDLGFKIADKYKILSTCELVGFHNAHEKALTTWCKFFKRSRGRMPLIVRKKTFGSGLVGRGKALTCFFAGISFLALFPVSLYPFFVLFAGGFLIAFIVGNWGFYRFIIIKKSYASFVIIACLHYIANLFAFFGATLGLYDVLRQRV